MLDISVFPVKNLITVLGCYYHICTKKKKKKKKNGTGHYGLIAH